MRTDEIALLELRSQLSELFLLTKLFDRIRPFLPPTCKWIHPVLSRPHPPDS